MMVNRTFISRIDYARGNYWYLRVPYKGAYVHHQTFSDKRYGGRDKALAAALIERDDYVYILGIDLARAGNHSVSREKVLHTKLSPRNTSGVVGVFFQRKWIAKIHSHREYYVACINFTKFKSTVRYFNVAKLGEKKAFKMAVDQRSEWELRITEMKKE